MKSLLFSAIVLFAACNNAPEGIRVEGNKALYMTLAIMDMFDDSDNLVSDMSEVEWRPVYPSDDQKVWLMENGFTYSHFEPDTTIGQVGGDNVIPIYAGRMVYRK